MVTSLTVSTRLAFWGFSAQALLTPKEVTNAHTVSSWIFTGRVTGNLTVPDSEALG